MAYCTAIGLSLPISYTVLFSSFIRTGTDYDTSENLLILKYNLQFHITASNSFYFYTFGNYSDS